MFIISYKHGWPIFGGWALDYSHFFAPPIFIYHKAKYFQPNFELNFHNFCLFVYVSARKENKKLTIIILLCLTIAKKV